MTKRKETITFTVKAQIIYEDSSPDSKTNIIQSVEKCLNVGTFGFNTDQTRTNGKVVGEFKIISSKLNKTK